MYHRWNAIFLGNIINLVFGLISYNIEVPVLKTIYNYNIFKALFTHSPSSWVLLFRYLSPQLDITKRYFIRLVVVFVFYAFTFLSSFWAFRSLLSASLFLSITVSIALNISIYVCTIYTDYLYLHRYICN